MLTSVDNYVNPFISTERAIFPVNMLPLIISHNKSTYNMLTGVLC